VGFTPEAYEYAKHKLNLNIFNCDLNRCCFPPDYFDVVFLVGTIEHLISPKEMLVDIFKILKPSGLIVITTLDTKGILPFYSFKPPEHLYYFNHDNIDLLLRITGFMTVSIKAHHSYFRISDLLYRVSKFTSMSSINIFSKKIRKSFFDISIRIPTNEMHVIAKKILSD